MVIQTHTYANGFRIIYQKTYSRVPISYIYAFCDVGSVYEPDELRGISHFIEHMCFKGTNKIPKSKNLLYHYDKIGAFFNAYTEKRYTAYTLKCYDKFMENSLVIMSDMILNSKFDKLEFKKEEKVVIEENISDADDIRGIIINILMAQFYKGSSFESPVDDIIFHKTRFDYDKIIDFYHTFYQPSRIVLSIVSNIPFDTYKRYLSHTSFVKKPRPNKICTIPQIIYTVEPQYEMQYYSIIKPNINTIHCYVGFRIETKDKYYFKTLKHILSSTFNSRLFLLLRENEGLTYTSRAYLDYNELYGGFFIYAESAKSKILHNGNKSKPGVLPIIIKMIRDLIKNGITEEELELAKGYIEGNLNMALSNNERIVTHNATSIMLYPKQKIIPFVELYDKCYKHITKNDIDNIIKDYFIYDKMTICMLGNHLPSESTIKKICSQIK